MSLSAGRIPSDKLASCSRLVIQRVLDLLVKKRENSIRVHVESGWARLRLRAIARTVANPGMPIGTVGIHGALTAAL